MNTPVQFVTISSCDKRGMYRKGSLCFTTAPLISARRSDVDVSIGYVYHVQFKGIFTRFGYEQGERAELKLVDGAAVTLKADRVVGEEDKVIGKRVASIAAQLIKEGSQIVLLPCNTPAQLNQPAIESKRLNAWLIANSMEWVVSFSSYKDQVVAQHFAVNQFKLSEDLVYNKLRGLSARQSNLDPNCLSEKECDDITKLTWLFKKGELEGLLTDSDTVHSVLGGSYAMMFCDKMAVEQMHLHSSGSIERMCGIRVPSKSTIFTSVDRTNHIGNYLKHNA